LSEKPEGLNAQASESSAMFSDLDLSQSLYKPRLNMCFDYCLIGIYRRLVYYVCMTLLNSTPRRGRPPKTAAQNRDIRAELIRSGLAHLTEIGFTASGLDQILKKVGVPKGSFYFYFPSKEAFGHAVLSSYANYFAHKLDSHLLDSSFTPMQRIRNFVEDAKQGIARHQFKRGCLVGNLGQEVDLLPESFRPVLIATFQSWQQRVAICLREAQLAEELAVNADCDALAEFFWIGWEGAISRARLEQSTRPLDKYVELFTQCLAG